jgi:hypothetical protein
MLADPRALVLCLRDADVRTDSSTLVQVDAQRTDQHELWIGLSIGRLACIEAIPGRGASVLLA